jgi:hypothetical protein
LQASITSRQSGLWLIPFVVILLIFGAYLIYTSSAPDETSTNTSTSTSSQTIGGVVTGLVTVGPSQPVCSANQSCNVNLTGYSLVFVSQCPDTQTSCQVQTIMAQLSPSGHYSIFVPGGNYTVTGLAPSCAWIGCSSAFPKSIVVEGGMQLEFDVNIDTGIR